MNVHEFAELAAGHALNALSPEDEQAFQTARTAHPEWAAIAERDAATAAALADGVAEIEPPPALREAILFRIAPVPPATEPAPDTEAVQTVSRRRWTRGLLALAASFVLLIAIGTGVAIIGDRLREPAAVSALREIESAEDSQNTTAAVEGGGTATLNWSDDVGKAVVVTSGLAGLDEDEAYQLWFVRDGTPESAGLFTTDADGSATALLNAPVQEGDTVAITVEPEGGSPTGQPTSDPITALPTA